MYSQKKRYPAHRVTCVAVIVATTPNMGSSAAMVFKHAPTIAVGQVMTVATAAATGLSGSATRIRLLSGQNASEHSSGRSDVQDFFGTVKRKVLSVMVS